MPLEVVRDDITKMKVDAVVNAANGALRQGGGVCGAIFAAAGAGSLQAECDRIGRCATGSAVVTKGYDLPAKYIIHTVGPVWRGGNHGEEALLASCYSSSLKLALDMGLTSVAFPLISSGIFGYPKEKALETAIVTIKKFLLEHKSGHEMAVYLVLYDSAAYMISDKLLKSFETYVDNLDGHVKP